MKHILTALLIGFIQLAVLAMGGMQLLGTFQFVPPAYSYQFFLGAVVIAGSLSIFGKVWATFNVRALDKAGWPWIRMAIAVVGGGAIMLWQGGFSGGFGPRSETPWLLLQIVGLGAVTLLGVKLRKLSSGNIAAAPTQDGLSAGTLAAIDAAAAAHRAAAMAPAAPAVKRAASRPAARSFGRRGS
jgi:hypothetical protein